MIIDIRGTHGSGKSYLIKMLLDKYNGWDHPIMEGKNLIGYSIKSDSCAIVGRYTNSGGGCDGIKTQDEVVRRVRKFNETHSHVLLEGILVGHTYTRYANLADELGRQNYVFAFLLTPHKTCVKRVEGRRARRKAAAKNSKVPLKPLNTFHLDNDFERIHKRLVHKFAENGYKTTELNWRDPLPDLEALLKGKK